MNKQKTAKASSNGRELMSSTRKLDEPTISDVAGDAVEGLRTYAKKRPEVVAMWCLGIGFVLGWKMKPW